MKLSRTSMLACRILLAGLAATSVFAAEDQAPDEIPLPTPAAPEPAPAAAAAAAAAAAVPSAPGPATTPKLMNINTASLEQLMTLPGFSERLAARVIAGRPYRSRVDLHTRNVVPEKTFAAIVDRIVAKSPKMEAK